jgi:3-deoxy-D-manno-octulosonate 8-phosphate phosphatase (KDO 8-P phosphatase)
LLAHVEVKAIAHYTTQAPAGSGAVREFCDLLITACGQYAMQLAEFQAPANKAIYKAANT